MLSIFKSALPKPILDTLRQAKSGYSRTRKLSEFYAVRTHVRHRKALSPPQRVLVFPADPWTLTGSLGDEAMMTAAITHLKDQNRYLEVHMLCQEHLVGQLARENGCVPIPIPADASFASKMQRVLEDGDYDALVLVGADIMDGYYDLEFVENMIITADLAARAGIATSFLGFSFNNAPNPELKRIYDTLHPEVTLNVRDEISLQRFRAFTPAATRLVADAAFLLKPGKIDQRTLTWIEEQKRQERTVIGVNAHSMLIKNASPEQVSQLVDKYSEALLEVSGRHNVSWIMIPHDYRDAIGDAVCLKPIFERLQHQNPANVAYFGGKHRAATLKALAGHLDGVVTGRMHLAIATLGMGVPALCLTYQDKFEGLYRHFELPKTLLLSPQKLVMDHELEHALDVFIRGIPKLKEQVAVKLPHVLSLARRNFSRASA